MKRSLNYGVRSPPKFMLWILNCSFKFSTLTVEFYSWINILHSSFKIHINFNVFLHLPFSFWTKLFYLTLFAVHFQPDKQIFAHCYFLIVLMPEPALYIWLRCQFCIDTHSPHFASHRVKVQTQRRIFSTKLLKFVYASVIIGRDKRSLCGGGRWRPIDLLPRLFRLATHDFHLKPKYCLLC